MTPAEVSQLASALVSEINCVIVGKTDTVEWAVLTLLCEGHLLIEDVPGVGKTTLAKALAKTVGGEFRRIQFTPDLLPSDITGSSIFNQNTNEFEFRPGPLFANIVLVDEVNRATPKTQSALLEAMEERQVSSDGVTRALPRPGRRRRVGLLPALGVPAVQAVRSRSFRRPGPPRHRRP